MASLAELEKQYGGQRGTSLADLERQHGISARPKANLTPEAIKVANEFLWSQQDIPEVEYDINQSLYEAAGRIDPAMMPTQTAVQQPRFDTAAPQSNQLRGREPGWMAEIRNALERGGLKMVASVPGTMAFLMQAGQRVPGGWYPKTPEIEAKITGDIVKLKEIAKTIYSDADREAIRARKGGVAGYIVNTTFETLPMMAMSSVAAIPGGAIGAAGAFSVAAIGEGEAAYQEAMKAMKGRVDLSQSQKEAIAQTERLIVGTINGMIEKMQADEVLTFAKGGKKYVKDMVNAVKQKAWGKVAASGAKIEGIHLIKAVSEGFEEFCQEGVSIGAARLHGDKIEFSDLGRMFKAGVGGLTAGYGLTAGGAMAQTAVEAAGRYDQRRQEAGRTRQIKTAYEQAKARANVEPGRPTPYEDEQETTRPEIGPGGVGFTPRIQGGMTADEMVEKLAGDGYKLEDLEAAVERAAVDKETKTKLDALFTEKTAQAKPEETDEAKGKTEAKSEAPVEDRTPVDVGKKKAEGQPEAAEPSAIDRQFGALPGMGEEVKATAISEILRVLHESYTEISDEAFAVDPRTVNDDALQYWMAYRDKVDDLIRREQEATRAEDEFEAEALFQERMDILRKLNRLIHQPKQAAGTIGPQTAPAKPGAAPAKPTESPMDKARRDLERKGASRVGGRDFKILQRDDGSYYYEYTEGGVRMTQGPAGANTWTREDAIDKAMQEIDYLSKDIIITEPRTGRTERIPAEKPEAPGPAAYGKALDDLAKQETDEVLGYRGDVRRYVTGQQNDIPQAPLNMPEDQKREIIRQEQEKADEAGKLTRTLFGRMPTAKKGKTPAIDKGKPLAPGTPKEVESTQETANEPRREEVDETAGTEGQPGVPGVPPARSAQGRGPVGTGPRQQPTVESGARTPEQDVSGTEPATRPDVSTPGVSSPTVEVGPERAPGRTGEGVSGPASNPVVPAASVDDVDAPGGRTSLDENYDLRSSEPVALTKGQRKDINAKAKEILKKDTITEEDRDILRQYTGEGGLSSGTKEALNQHYTDYDTIKAIYRAIKASGFKPKTALEPSVGSGNFVGMQPGLKWTTVDIDETNHKVVSKLYPKGTHYLLSFEQFKQGGYDLIISNVPFSEERGKGRLYNRPDIKALHDFYFAHALNLVRDNGVIAFITSTGTMDKADDSIRKEIVSKADVLGAFRLPQGHFKKNAHTEVITDIIFLQKRPEGAVPTERQQEINEAFVSSVQTPDDIRLNGYYYAMFPEHVLGTMEVGKDKLHGGRPSYVISGEARLDEIAFEYKPYVTETGATEAATDQDVPTNSKEFYAWAAENSVQYRQSANPKYGENIWIDGDDVYVATREIRFSDIEDKVKLYEKATGREVEQLLLLNRILDRATAFQEGQQNAGAEGIELIDQYRQTYKKHPSKDRKLKRFFKDHGEESYFLELAALFDAKGNPADVFLQQTRYKGSGKAEARGSLQERAFANEDNRGIIRVAEAEGIEEEDVLGLLASGYALLDIEDGGSVLQNEILYYSGNVYQKLDKAKVIDVKAPREYESAIRAQIERLEAIMPEPKTLDEIRFKGTEEWIYKLLRDHGVVSWKLDTDSHGVRAWITGDRILDNYLNSTALVSHRQDETLPEYMERMRDAEEHVNEVYDRLRERIMDSPSLAKKVEESYNRRFRNYVKPDYEKARYLVQDVLDEIEAKSPIRLRKNQVEWIIQAVYEGKGINAHDVGGGKTFAAIALARVLKKRGVAKKPMFVVPAKTIKKWHRDIKTLFPDAKVVDLGSLPAAKRTKALFELANTNADYVLVSTEGFTQIKLPVELEMQYIDDVIAEHVDDPDASGRARATLLERIDRLKAVMEEEQRDTRLTFDKLGIDMIVADEAHAYKNIGIRSRLVQYGLGKGFGLTARMVPTGTITEDGKEVYEEHVSLKSSRAYDFRFKANYIVQNNNGRNIFLLTATPTPNKPMEIYTMIRHLSLDIFHEYGIYSDQDFADTFFRLGTVEDQNSRKSRNILEAIVNAQELRGILNRFVDKIPMEQMPWITIPAENAIDHFFDQPDAYADIRDDMDRRRHSVPRHPKAGDDTLVAIYTSGRSASVDPRLYGGEHAAPEVIPDTRTFNADDDKIQFVLEAVQKVHQANRNAGQLIFLDAAGHQQVEKGRLAEDLHAEIKRELVKAGFKKTEVAIINGKVVTNPKTGADTASGDKDMRKQEIADAYNEGKIKVVIGTTTSMGEGMDLQVKTTDIYHLDIPYTPGAFRQRNGRAIRYGNENDTVNTHYFFMRGTFDSLSYEIVAHKRGWNEALWDKEVADEISTAEEMTEGAMPTQEQIMIELETDPVRKQFLILSFQYQRLVEERDNYYQLGRRAKERLRRTRDKLTERKEILKGQRQRLADLKPEEDIKDPEKRRETYERQKAILENSIEISLKKQGEIEANIEKLQKRATELDAHEAEANGKIEQFRRDHMNERGEIIATDPDQDPTVDFPSAQGGFVGGRPGRTAARAQLSAIVNEDMKTGSKAADDFLRRNRGYTINAEAPGALRNLASRTAGFVREFHFLPHLPKTAAFAEVREAFRHSMEIAKHAYTDAAEAMKWALQPIKGTKTEVAKRYDALVMKLQADSLAEDIEKGVALPPDMTEADVEAMKAKADRLYAKYPSVRQAYDRLREKTTEVTDLLVDMGWLQKAQAKEFYFPHKVIKYLQQNRGFFGITRKPAVPRKGYLKQRKGGHDYAIDLDYMVDHWAQVRRDVAMTKFLERTLKKEQEDHFKTEYPDWKQGDPIPAGFKEVTVLPGRFYYKAHGVSEDLAMALVNQDLAMIEAILDEKQQKGMDAVRTALAVGRKRSFIVREQVADQVYDMPTAPISEGMAYNAIKAFNTFVKRQILFNPLYAVPFHVTNFIGDAHKVLVAAPGALKGKGMVGYWTAILDAHNGRKPKLFDEAQEFGVIGSGWIGVDVKSLQALLPEIEKAEISGASAVAIGKAKRLFNLLKTAGESREDWLRYATFAYLCELQDKGMDIAKYATKDTKVVKGLTGHEQAAKIARDILGDYSAIGKSGRILADLAMPFYRWMHLNLPWWPRLIKEYGRRGDVGRAAGALMAALAPYIAAMLWNYSDDDRRKFEEKLPPWKRWTFHVVGVHGKKLYYIPLPLDDLVQFFGLDNSLADFTAYQKGIIDLRTLAARIALNSATEPGMGVVNAVGGLPGVIRDAFGIKTFPELADYRIKEWDRRAMNVAKDIFGAPAQLVEAVRREDSVKTHDLMWRSVLPVRPWTPTSDPMDALASRTYREDQQAAPMNPERWRAHKGKQIEVDRLKAQVAGESPEDLRRWHLQDRARRAKERIERRRELLEHGEKTK